MSAKFVIARLLYGLKGLFEDPVDLFRALAVQPGDRILEVGCALGYHTLALAQLAREGKVYAVDTWGEALDYLRAKPGAERVEILHCSAEAVELPAASLDKVVCFDVLHEVPEPQRAVARWLELLRPGGQLLYRDPRIGVERVLALAAGRLQPAGEVTGVHILARA